MVIALTLLIVLIAGAAWYAWRTAREVVPRPARDTAGTSLPRS
jgi:hypothetical protein